MEFRYGRKKGNGVKVLKKSLFGLFLLKDKVWKCCATNDFNLFVDITLALAFTPKRTHKHLSHTYPESTKVHFKHVNEKSDFELVSKYLIRFTINIKIRSEVTLNSPTPFLMPFVKFPLKTSPFGYRCSARPVNFPSTYSPETIIPFLK